MDVVSQLSSTNINDIIEPTMNAFIKLLEEHRVEIDGAQRKTFQYGATERHQVDVFYPSPGSSGAKPAILFFTYGGGLALGDRVLADTSGKLYPPTNNLLYTNIGAFFAKYGFLFVMADYRLVPAGAKYPDAHEDVRDALVWTVENLKEVGDVERIFGLGHSVGAMLVSSLLLHPSMLSHDTRARIRGAILNGGTYDLGYSPDINPLYPQIIEAYFGPGDAHASKTSIGLLSSASDELLRSLPPFYIIDNEKDPVGIRKAHKEFVEELAKRNVKNMQHVEVPVHNHISAVCAPSSGEGEEWTFKAMEWMKKL